MRARRSVTSCHVHGHTPVRAIVLRGPPSFIIHSSTSKSLKDEHRDEIHLMTSGQTLELDYTGGPMDKRFCDRQSPSSTARSVCTCSRHSVHLGFISALSGDNNNNTRQCSRTIKHDCSDRTGNVHNHLLKQQSPDSIVYFCALQVKRSPVIYLGFPLSQKTRTKVQKIHICLFSST